MIIHMWRRASFFPTKSLDYLLDFACDEKILKLYKRVCRRYLCVYLGCIKFYMEEYWEMWEDEENVYGKNCERDYSC